MGLNQQTAAELTRLGERIKNTLKTTLTELLPDVNSINSLSQVLNYHRSNSQRIFNARQAANGHQVLCLLPGVKAFSEFVSKVAPHISSATQSKLNKSSRLFAEAISLYAKSHADLKRQLTDLNSQGQLLNEQDDSRMQLYVAAKSLLGFSIDHVLCSYVLTENQAESAFLQETALISKLGIERQQGAAPFVQFYTHPHPNDFTKPNLLTSKSMINQGQFSVGIVDQYSTAGLYDAYSSYSPSNSGIVFDDIPDASVIDATFIFNNPDELVNPLTHSSQCSSTSISIKNPAKKLTLIVFVDKKINKTSNVNVGCYHGNQKVEEGKLSASDMWTERLPDFPELKIISLDSPSNYFTKNPDIAEKVDFLLSYSETARTQFVCYLMEVDYPIWSSTYRVYFEHSEQ